METVTNPSPNSLHIQRQREIYPPAIGSAVSQSIAGQNTHTQAQAQTQTSAIALVNINHELKASIRIS